jgi:hypothetical protein
MVYGYVLVWCFSATSSALSSVLSSVVDAMAHADLQDAWSDTAPRPGPGDDFKQGDKWIRSDLIELPSDRGKADGSFPGEGVIQPGVWESRDKPGHCHMTMRSSVGCIIQADSTDYGRTWGPAYRTSLPNNNSGHCVTILRDGRVVW